jgi:hypothetical protein
MTHGYKGRDTSSDGVLRGQGAFVLQHAEGLQAVLEPFSMFG